MGKQSMFTLFKTRKANFEREKEVTIFSVCLKFEFCYLPRSLSLIPLRGKDCKERGFGTLLPLP